MAARRDLVTWIAEYGKILNFTVLKPLTNADEEVDKTLFALELNEESGGNADLELLKILRKVQHPFDLLNAALEFLYLS